MANALIGFCTLYLLIRFGYIRFKSGDIHQLHKLLSKRFRLGNLFWIKDTDGIKVIQRIGLSRLTGGLVQRDSRYDPA